MNGPWVAAGKEPIGQRSRYDIAAADIPMNWVLTNRTLTKLKESASQFRDAADLLLQGREQALRHSKTDNKTAAKIDLVDIPTDFKEKLKLVAPPPNATTAMFREKVYLADKLYRVTAKSAEDAKKVALPKK
jgi:hypothetical protein